MESLFEYGSRAGFWRLHRAFASRGVPVTVYPALRARLLEAIENQEHLVAGEAETRELETIA
jgi:allantoinase